MVYWRQCVQQRIKVGYLYSTLRMNNLHVDNMRTIETPVSCIYLPELLKDQVVFARKRSTKQHCDFQNLIFVGN